VNGSRALVLDEDGDLAELVPPPLRDNARQSSVATTVELDPGQWDARVDADRAREGYGLLTLDGVLVRRVGYGGRYGAELLTAGDLLRPWEFDGDESIGFETTWRVLSGTRLAVLDSGWTEQMQINTIEPSPVGESSRDGKLALELGHIPAGQKHVLWMQFQVNPTNVGRRSQDVALYDDTTLLAQVDRTVTIFP